MFRNNNFFLNIAIQSAKYKESEADEEIDDIIER